MRSRGKGRKRISLLECLVFICIIIGLPSCGSKRVAKDLSIDYDSMTRIERMIDELISRRVVDVRRSDLSGDIFIREREFDTDKPIDPSTGERPVSREVETNIRIAGTDGSLVVDTSYVHVSDNVDLVGDDEVTVDESEEKDRGGAAWPIAVVFICLLGIFIVILIGISKLNSAIRG